MYCSIESARKKASSSNFSVARKTIYNLGDFSGLTWDTPSVSLYQKYMAGEDLVIAGTTYNKSTHGDAKLLTPRNLGGSNLNKEGNIVFLSAGKYTTGGDATLDHDIVVIGDDPDDKPVITTTVYTNSSGKQAIKTWIVQGISFTGYNLKFEFPKENGTAFTFMTNNKATKDTPLLAFEDCIFRNCPTNLYSTHTSSTGVGYGIKEILFNRCIVENSNEGTSNLINVQGGMTNPTAFEKLTLTNNVFYNSSGSVVTWLLFTYYPSLSDALTAKTWPQQVKLENNILYNIASNSSNIRNYSMTFLSVKNNLIVCPDYTPANGMKIAAMRVKPAPSYFTPDYGDNRVYAAAGSEDNWVIADDAFSTDLGQTKKIPLLSENPLSKADLANGEFEVKAAYSAYGPQK